jgi:hypothetical protein
MSVNGVRVHAASTVYRHSHMSRAWVTEHLCVAEVVLFVDFLFCVSLGRLTRVGFNGLLRPRALYVWGWPFRLAASRVRRTCFRVPVPSSAGPGLFVVAFDRWFLSEAVVLEAYVV